MALENKTGLGVYNSYGARDTIDNVTAGVEHTKDSRWILTLRLTSKGLEGKYLSPIVIPGNLKFTGGNVQVLKPITAKSAVKIGGADVSANYVEIAAADLSTAGYKEIDMSAAAGTWATVTDVNEFMAIECDGASNEDGYAIVQLEFTYKVYQRPDGDFSITGSWSKQ